MRARVSPVQKGLWFMESHLGSEITLEDIASVAGVSRYHLTRAFGEATGQSIMRYLRARRLTEAARCLANGAPDILAVALDAGYGSNEAFTRIFRDHFGLTPSALRKKGQLDNIKLLEPIKPQETLRTSMPPVRLEHGKVFLIAGVAHRYTSETTAGIPAQWQLFLPHMGNIRGQIGKSAFGVCCNSDNEGNFDYLCGVEVGDFWRLPSNFTHRRIAAQKYAVFSHREHISAIRSTLNTIWNKWLPESGLEVVDAPGFERYGEGFDSRTGFGGLEIWIPIKP